MLEAGIPASTGGLGTVTAPLADSPERTCRPAGNGCGRCGAKTRSWSSGPIQVSDCPC
jgi:hypothetical protein